MNNIDWIEYEHPRYPKGTRLKISAAIRKIHPQSPVAEKFVVSTVGHYSPVLGDEESKKSCIPVEFEGEVHYVEEDYASSSLPPR